jgi:hypothetical protein
MRVLTCQSVLSLALTSCLALATACASDDTGDGTDGTTGTDGVTGTAATDGTDGTTGTTGGVPTFADVQVAYKASCTPCHEGSNCAGATCFVSSIEEALKPSAFCTGLTVAECNIQRIEAGTMPPGGGAVPAADLQLMKDWVDGGFEE